MVPFLDRQRFIAGYWTCDTTKVLHKAKSVVSGDVPSDIPVTSVLQLSQVLLFAYSFFFVDSSTVFLEADMGSNPILLLL